MKYSVEQLQKEHAAGKRGTFLFFWGHTPCEPGKIDKSCLSQWWISPFVIDGVPYSCSEQYMMAEKARLFQDGEMLAAILQASGPKEMKAFGRAVKNFDKSVWESRCFAIVKKGNLAKFSQNALLGLFLKSTDNSILVEASPHDRIWGIGMGQSDSNAANPLEWRGKNWLGFALMEVRDELFNERRDNHEP
ncbi:NADAR family protein [Paenibacillus glycanilyticus]|uniref:NADAR family protein n=1 Tax=Paenibacillus glycanilyticus TaxID=126569 RepID=UPI003EC11D63